MYGNPYMQNYQNPYMMQSTQNNSRYEIIKVNGENGARAYQMPPNSTALLLDESQPVVWLKSTDGAGYPTVTPYKIEPYKPQPQADYTGLEERISRLEGIINESYSSGSKSE